MLIKAAINFKAVIKMLLLYFTYSQSTECNTPTTAPEQCTGTRVSMIRLRPLHTKRMDKDTRYFNVHWNQGKIAWYNKLQQQQQIYWVF